MKQGCFQQYFIVVGTVMSKFMYIYISTFSFVIVWDVYNVLSFCLFKKVSGFCCVGHLQMLSFIGVMTSFWQVLQLLA